MNGRHLPAGQGLSPHQQHQQHQDPSRRRQYNNQQHPHQNQHLQQHHAQYQPQPPPPLYNNGYMNPYNPYYSPMPPQYHHGGGPPNQYAQYQAYGRSPPPQFQQQYQQPPPPPPVVSSYPTPRPQQSPVVVSSPYQPPPLHTPVSSQSSHTLPVSEPALQMPPVHAPISESTLVELPPPPPFQPPLPWFSRPDLGWPTKAKRSRRRRKAPTQSNEDVELPRIPVAVAEISPQEPTDTALPKAPRPETPSTAQPPSEEAPSTTPTTPSSVQQPSSIPVTSTLPTTAKSASRVTAAVPIVPVFPKPSSRSSSGTVNADQKSPPLPADKQTAIDSTESEDRTDTKSQNAEGEAKPAQPNTAPKLWTDLLKGGPTVVALSKSGTQPASSGAGTVGVFSKVNNDSLADALRVFNATAQDTKLAFLKPRGLVNTGNMCYMNSVLQVLVFCIPFYDFLDLIGKRATHSFKSETPLIDAMIMFMREFPVIDSATSIEKLRLRLKDNELEQYGEAFTPDFVYNVVAALPRFATMRRGHQQDAEEFLGFLLEGLHDECVQAMRTAGSSNGASAIATPTNVPSSPVTEVASLAVSTPGEGTNAWLEVGPKQRAAITRSSGTISLESPITKIFGGTLRSELRVQGLKDSVTMEPYQPLQLDIGSPQVNNILDALKGLTRPESLRGDFKSPRGPNASATKQVMIETLPPVLILHLKRFQYDNTGGTQKIWKKIGYPLELEIPKEVFSRQRLNGLMNHGGLPRYRLIAVVYHHGKNASGGHYTVDVRRQEGREWIRLDDTVIRRVRSEDVAEGGSEEDPKVIAAALDAHKKDSIASGNMFSKINMDEEDGEEDGEDWKQVNGSSASSSNGKKWSSVVNGTATPKGKSPKSGIQDNKVAYLLFYQRI